MQGAVGLADRARCMTSSSACHEMRAALECASKLAEEAAEQEMSNPDYLSGNLD